MTVFPTLSKQTWPHEAVAGDLDSFYGDPRGSMGRSNPQWEVQNLTSVIIPWAASSRSFQIHRKCADSIKRILQAIWDFYGQDQTKIYAAHLNEFDGSYNFRPNVNSPSRLSLHAYGAAVDFAANENPNGKPWKDDGTMLPRPVIDAFLAEGWCWGGDFSGTKDAMHFQATFNAHSDAPQDQPAGGTLITTSPSITVLPPNQELDRIKQILSDELGLTDKTEALRTLVIASLNKLIDDVKGFDKTTVVLPTQSQDTWFLGITATMFGGSTDPNNSAYDEHFITDQELGVALPYHFSKPLPTFEIRSPLGSHIVPVVDVGPWYDNRPGWPYDPWFLTPNARPRAETDRRTNSAGIDLTPALARALGIDGKGKVDVRYIPSTEGVQPMTSATNVTVPVISPLASKINWTSAIQIAASVLTFASGGKFNLDTDQQLAIVTLISTVGPVLNIIFRTFATKAVVSQSV